VCTYHQIFFRVITSRERGRGRQGTLWEWKCLYSFDRKTWRKESLRRSRRRRIMLKWCLNRTDGVKWIHLVQDRGTKWADVNSVVNRRVPQKTVLALLDEQLLVARQTTVHGRQLPTWTAMPLVPEQRREAEQTYGWWGGGGWRYTATHS
jgi:hypothetical protein